MLQERQVELSFGAPGQQVVDLHHNGHADFGILSLNPKP